jgi:predicted helicase
MSSLIKLLKKYQEHSKTEREKGRYFEELVATFLRQDKLSRKEFKQVLSYTDWAKEQDYNAKDDGIDLVAKNMDDEFIAIQCKFYKDNSKINKSDIDSFIAASSKKFFKGRILVDTTSNGLDDATERLLKDSSLPFRRITTKELEESSIDWEVYDSSKKIVSKRSHSLRPHQQEALQAISEGLQNADRGKLIMACGTGKTFTSLKIAEKLAGIGKKVLFLVPSLALMSQTIREWVNNSEVELYLLAVCSDTQVGKRKNIEDLLEMDIHDLAYPATTDSIKLAAKAKSQSNKEMLVVFSTYQSIEVISEAQLKHSMDGYDLIICDEAHRTTGAKLKEEKDESSFMKIHDEKYIIGSKRLYMTATPRIFVSEVKDKAKEKDAILASMDDEEVYGKTLYTLPFGEAVDKGLLTDYKVIVLAVDEAKIARDMQARLSDENSELKLDDASKIIGCYRALGKFNKMDGNTGKVATDESKLDVNNDELPSPMKRAVAFCRDIKSSKLIMKEFQATVSEYIEHQKSTEKHEQLLNCETDHVDGSMRSNERNNLLNWLKEETEEDVCRILSNARCLSEGVDVPTLDAIIFMHPRKSTIDVVQSVGRVMRRVEGKSLGYVIIPIGIPAQVKAEDALNDNKKYKVVWEVLNALRAHDERLDADINKIDLEGTSDKIEVISEMEVTSKVKDLPSSNKQMDNSNIGIGSDLDDDREQNYNSREQLALELDSVQKAVYAKIVRKCGTRGYWEDWAGDVSEIAKKHVTRIKVTLQDKQSDEYKAFNDFLTSLQRDLNKGVTEDEAIEMLAQHLITEPVFDTLFKDYKFTQYNPVSKAIHGILEILHEQHIDTESKSLKKFYKSVKTRVKGITSLEGQQKIILELYDKFFSKAFPRTVEKLGIVYTPVEVVDFIIQSVGYTLKKEFGQSLNDDGVHIIDPFTGTGTFITRLLQSGLISKERLGYKYHNEIHANEILLLAYYIATVNIETVYHDIMKGGYKPFSNICLADTFAMYDKKEQASFNSMLEVNSERQQRQSNLPIQVIIGNPPYSAGQKNANDNNANTQYKTLDKAIEESYAKHSDSANKNSLYDSYVRALKWAGDRIGEKGVIGFITNAGFLSSNASAGIRKCLKDEFSKIYIFNLRGNSRVSGEKAKKEGGNVFDIRTPVAITIFIKNPDSKEQGKIYYHEMEDCLKKGEKLRKIADYMSIEGITNAQAWQEIMPDEHNDWLDLRDKSFDEFISIGDKKDKSAIVVFENYSSGVKTNRDTWVYHYSKSKLASNMNGMIAFYNSEVERYEQACSTQCRDAISINDFVNNDATKISWSDGLKTALKRGDKFIYNELSVVKSVYRPFANINCYFDRSFNERVYQMPKIFPEDGIENLAICVSGIGASTFSVLMTDRLVDLNSLQAGAQCFPLKLYDKKVEDDKYNLFSNADTSSKEDSQQKYTAKDGITDKALKHFADFYNSSEVIKEDVFYYIYGLLHSKEYRERYANNLAKKLPHIPCVKNEGDFWEFSKIGKKLAELHINYEKADLYPVKFKDDICLDDLDDEDFRVTKMKFAKNGKDSDKSIVIYNRKITMINVPLEVYNYVINGKSALGWVMARQAVLEDKNSKIENDANDYAGETMCNPRYPLELFQRVITVSLKTLELIESLPALTL